MVFVLCVIPIVSAAVTAIAQGCQMMEAARTVDSSKTLPPCRVTRSEYERWKKTDSAEEMREIFKQGCIRQYVADQQEQLKQLLNQPREGT